MPIWVPRTLLLKDSGEWTSFNLLLKWVQLNKYFCNESARTVKAHKYRAKWKTDLFFKVNKWPNNYNRNGRKGSKK